MFGDPSTIDLTQQPRAITFENPAGERGAGGTAHGGRKGAPSRTIAPGERIVLADIAGPGTVRHIWMTFPPAPPEAMRSIVIEAFYDGADAPSVSVPALDFFGLACGRPVPYASALSSAQEGRGFNAYFPMPFGRRLRLEFVNGSTRTFPLYFQVDYTLGPVAPESGYLHVSFRRENPTVMGRDFVIADGLRGPGRFLGCVVGIRVLDAGFWYGEGEVKVYLDGDRDHPTICGTGLEDYVGSAWGMGPHQALYAGVPLDVREGRSPQPAFVSFYRWHVPDPIVFRDSLRVTIQQIGFAQFREGQEEAFAAYAAGHPAAGGGWTMHGGRGSLARGICERVDDYSAAAFLYCREPQAVARVAVAAAAADLARLPYERADPFEAFFG
ncbi:MAG: glycoside hydrolase family 172 protein [Dehalococcoidia bacterium]